MFGTLMLDETGDLISAFETVDGVEYDTIAVALGSQQVAQAFALNVSTKQGAVWFNRAAGIDYNGLFYSAPRSDAVMNPIRAQAFRQALENTPGFGSYDGSKDVSFSRTDRRLAIQLPCVVIDCDNSRVTPAVIG